MGTLAGITFQEIVGSNAGDVARDTTERERGFLVDWSDKEAFMQALIGGVQRTGDGDFDYLVTLPERYEAGSLLRATGCHFEGIGPCGVDGNGLLQYQKAKITTRYAPLDAEDQEDGDEDTSGVWAREQCTGQTQMTPTPSWGLRWDSDNEHLDDSQVAAIPVTTKHITLTRYNVGVLPRDTFNAAEGLLNSTTFRGYTAKKLLFQSWDYDYSVDVLGNKTKYTVVVHLLARTIPWDYMYRPGSGWALVERTDGVALISTTDFNDL